MIDPALVLLARLRVGAWLRRIRRGMSSKRGIAFFILGCVVFMMWLVPTIMSALIGSGSTHHRPQPSAALDLMPLILLGSTLVMALFSTGKIASFSLAEIDFLFAGPFSRRQLVLWKIAISGFAALWMSLLMSIWLMRSASMWMGAFIGIWLAWMFAQSLAMLILLARQAITDGRLSLAVRVVLGVPLVLMVIAVADILRPLLPLVFGGEFKFSEFLAHQQESLPARSLLAPFEVLSLTFTAPRMFPDLLMWMAAGCGMIAVVIWLVLRLDGYFVETSLRTSEATQAVIERMKRSGGSPFGAASRSLTGVRVPMLPWLGGSGPVAWRQIMLAIRGARGLTLVLVLLVAGLSPFLLMVGKSATIAVPLIIGAGFWMLFLLPTMLRFDFRGDLRHIENLKLLPIRPARIAIGQMLTPSIVLTALVAGLIAAVITIGPDQAVLPSFISLLFLPLITFLLIGIENATFLMFPHAQMMNTPGDMTMMGRVMVVFFLKAMTILVVLCAIAGIGGGVLAMTHSWTVALGVAWIVAAIAAAGTVPIVARLFASFDPSMDRPPA